MTREVKIAMGDPFKEPSATSGGMISVVTRVTFSASPASVWEGLLFYEEIRQLPPKHLRLLLPTPVRTEGCATAVGDEMMCSYEGGHLLKRITRIDSGSRYEFEIAAQTLTFGGGIRLHGGSYALLGVSEGRTEVCLETRFHGARSPRWLWKPIERTLCHSFHRYLLGSMRGAIESA